MEIESTDPISGAYGIWCGDDVYVGASANIFHRWAAHMRDMRSLKHEVPKLQDFFNEHGACNIRFEILQESDSEDIFKVEKKWGIRYAKNLLNRMPFEKADLTRYYRSVHRKHSPLVNPEWIAWMELCAYDHRDAKLALGLANGTFYRRIAKAPTHIEQLAMRALYEGLEPFTTKRIEG